MSERARCAVVVGNSDGIGLGLTRRLLDEGWSVVGVSRRPNDLDHPRYVHETVDVTAAAYPEVLAGAVARVDRIDLCVYAAGIGQTLDPANLPAQTRTLEVNLMGAARTIDVVVPRMIATGGGHLVGLSSLADVLILPDSPAYPASKAGMTSYLRGLGPLLRRNGVHVTVVRFGFVDTKMAKGPVRPLMIPVSEAVDVLMRCVRTRPTMVSYPRRMAVLARVAGAVARARLRVGR